MRLKSESSHHPIAAGYDNGWSFLEKPTIVGQICAGRFYRSGKQRSFLVPAIPGIPVRQRDISCLFTENPFNAMGWLPIFFYPFAIGLCFFAPLDLTFSVWFFYLCSKAQRVLGGITGWQKITSCPYYDEQMFGAALVVFFFALWEVGNISKTSLKLPSYPINQKVIGTA